MYFTRVSSVSFSPHDRVNRLAAFRERRNARIEREDTMQIRDDDDDEYQLTARREIIRKTRRYIKEKKTPSTMQ